MLGFGSKSRQAASAAVGGKDRFETIINSIADGVIMIDKQQVVQLLNPAAAELCGWKIDEATGINVNQVFKLANKKGEPLKTSEDPLHKIMESDKPIRVDEAFLLNRNNSQVAISLSLTPLPDPEGHVSGVVAVFRDVSTETAQQQQRADFISTASHEMRTPVAAIEGYLALALNEKVATIDARARDYLDKAHASAQHLGQLFQDLLTSAKAEDGRLTSHPTAVELGSFLDKLTSDLRLVAEKKGLFVEFVVGSKDSVINATKSGAIQKVVRPLYYVYVDPDRLREVITNLFDNAVKYTPEGKVSLGLTGDGNVVQCYVRDTGPGIPAEDLPHLFQKFYRVDNSATRTIGGTGLGLFICRKIIELYSGRIWAESEVGKGSTFYINLPRLSDQKAAELQKAVPAVEPLEPSSSL
ncbi:MAG TPA: ATP-binding protein [Candidatus Saccharimonadales bacterium]|nr:ATP-binding protein [Candidatus Saccharimonadales bacterium]